GATIGPDATGDFVVKGLFPNGPAMRGGVQVGDRLLRVDGVSTVGMTTNETTRRIRGEAKTEVVLTLLRGDQTIELRLIREELTIPNVSSRAGPQGVGVLKIDHFSEQTDRYLGEGLGSLAEQGLLAEGLVIDLRGNTGGSLVQSARAADTFVGEGLIVRTAGRGGAPVSGLVGQIMAQPDRPGYAMPMVVLMDRATASGSEILAGALRYLDRALLVGTPSFGKGTVQKTYTLAPELKLKLTVAEYLLDGDVRVADVGLAPDLALTEVHFNSNSIWYADPERLRARLPAGTPTLPLVVEEGAEPTDGTLDVAAGLLRAALGGTRDQMLDATLGQLLLLRAAADSALEAAYQRHQIDWTSGELPTAVKVDVEVSGADHLERGAEGTLYWKIQNQGDALHRAALRLRSVESTWEDRVLPLGTLATGEQRTVGLKLSPEPGSSRRDPVEIWLEVEGRPAELLRVRTLGLEGEDPAELRVSARFLPCPLPCATRPELELTVENRGRSSLTGLVASLGFPEDPKLELLEEETAP
ncbi:MAG TPA: S41 family peptidase, partial [Myxococcota bacterium]|nr:S41 family peptidase [Myxococcota bacterium]